jgi:hypothetical protein
MKILPESSILLRPLWSEARWPAALSLDLAPPLRSAAEHFASNDHNRSLSEKRRHYTHSNGKTKGSETCQQAEALKSRLAIRQTVSVDSLDEVVGWQQR